MTQPQPSNTTLFVCTTCGIRWERGRRVGRSGGEKLLHRLQAALDDGKANSEGLNVCPVECMSACDRGCIVSLTASGKYTYLFGDLPADEDNLEDISQAILDFASRYEETSDGALRWSERPPLLKKRAIAKIPPLPNRNSA